MQTVKAFLVLSFSCFLIILKFFLVEIVGFILEKLEEAKFLLFVFFSFFFI